MSPVMAYDHPKVEPMHLHTRALRRASDVASARRPLTILTAAVGALLGVTLTLGVASTAAGAEPLPRFNDRAAMVIMDAEQAVASAESLTADVATAGLDVGEVSAVDTAGLTAGVTALDDRAELSGLTLSALAAWTDAEVTAVRTETTALQDAFTAAKEKKAAEEAAQAAAEKAAAEKAAQVAAALASANTVAGAKATAEQLASSDYGWGSGEFTCLVSLWNKESGWNYQAYNSSGATGIPQALPGSKMASAGSDWQTSARTQIIWGLGYISSVYGSPCSAWSHSQSVGWY